MIIPNHNLGWGKLLQRFLRKVSLRRLQFVMIATTTPSSRGLGRIIESQIVRNGRFYKRESLHSPLMMLIDPKARSNNQGQRYCVCQYGECKIRSVQGIAACIFCEKCWKYAFFSGIGWRLRERSTGNDRRGHHLTPAQR
ncbi:MAG: hypothetical protein DMG63_13425 [Acidobacteria bacterium]|nr:MAG: hypothetical protein DMG63_13425 [Acidobacteriota bacterium]